MGRNLNWAPDWKENYSKELNPKNKYNAESMRYNGYTYQSKKEAKFAQNLDLLLASGEIKCWTRQHPWKLYVNGVKIRTYSIDFRVVNNDGSVDYHEIKGARTYDFQITWNLTKALFHELTKGETARLYINGNLTMTSHE